MAVYDPLPLVPAPDDAPSASEVGAGLPSKYSVSRLRIGSRAELIEDTNTGCACEVWYFDEDVYTLGLEALYNSWMPEALPTLLLAVVAPALQLYIILEVYGYLARHGAAGGGHLGARLVCSALSVLQLTNEAVEGLHKVVFSLRWLLGFYEGPCCPVSATAGSVLGFMQMLLGVSTCTLCIEVIFHAESILDTFFNYVALAFIADVDNYIINSRIVRSFWSFDPQLKVRWVSADKLEAAKARWIPLVAGCCNTVILLMLPISALSNAVRNWGAAEPVELRWLGMAPRCAALWLAVNGAMWLGGRSYPICAVAFCVTLCNFLLQVVAFIVVLSRSGKNPEHGCRAFTPPERVVLWGFSSMLLPASCAATLRPFGMVKLIPLQVIMVITLTLIWDYELSHYGCA